MSEMYHALINSTNLKDIIMQVFKDGYHNYKLNENITFNWFKSEIEKRLPFPNKNRKYPILCRKIEAVTYKSTVPIEDVEIATLYVEEDSITLSQYQQQYIFKCTNNGKISLERVTTHCSGSVYPTPLGRVLISYKDAEAIKTLEAEVAKLMAKIEELQKKNEELTNTIEKLKIENAKIGDNKKQQYQIPATYLIVRDGLINGKLKHPPTVIHFSREAVKKELERLARENPGITFRLYVSEKSVCYRLQKEERYA